jgi:hypothetical protein
MALLPELFADFVGELPVVAPRPAASMPLTPQAFAELLVTSHILHNAAQEQLALLVNALDGGPRCVAAAGDNGIVLHARSATALDDDRLPGARLFTDAEQALPALLGRTREICAAVQRTRSDTRALVARARELRTQVEAAIPSDRDRKSGPTGEDAF